MDRQPSVSIVISSYNYARFLPAAIESVLAQTYANVEVLVVDDGSVDGSAEVAKAFGDRVAVIEKANGGQASAFNVGFAQSAGDLVVFLDSDDALASTVVAEAVERFHADPSLSKVHWPLEVVDGDGQPSGRVVPGPPLSEGDLRAHVLRCGPGEYAWPPTSGNLWSRRFLNAALPMPEEAFRTCPDLYLSALAPFYGPIARLDAPRGIWRVHGDNNSWKKPFDATLSETVTRCDHCLDAVAEHCAAMNISIDRASWRANSWWYRIADALEDLRSACSGVAGSIVLVDQDEWAAGSIINDRQRRHFTEREGVYAGPPASGHEAVAELERMHRQGANCVAFAWPAFWWLSHYAELAAVLARDWLLVLDNDRLKVFCHRGSDGGS